MYIFCISFKKKIQFKGLIKLLNPNFQSMYRTEFIYCNLLHHNTIIFAIISPIYSLHLLFLLDSYQNILLVCFPPYKAPCYLTFPYIIYSRCILRLARKKKYIYFCLFLSQQNLILVYIPFLILICSFLYYR